MTLDSLFQHDGDHVVELVLDPRIWMPVDVAPRADHSLQAATRVRRTLSSAELADCTCPVDCLRDHANE